MADNGDEKALREEIERRAYQRFCDRGCEHGADRDDWLAAEREILRSNDQAQPEQPPRAPADARRRRRRGAET